MSRTSIPRIRSRQLVPISLGLWLASACLFDPDERCGLAQHYDGTKCVCDDGLELSGAECIPCGDHEISSENGCVCGEGYFRNDEDDSCERVKGLGDSCEDDEDCTDPAYGHCQPTEEGGYCTKADCKSSDDCDGEYACRASGQLSFCERPPSGLGASCSSNDDCSDYEASFCEAVVNKSCVVNDCADAPNICHGDWVCCDIGLLSESLCIPPEELADGACPAGGSLVPREEE